MSTRLTNLETKQAELDGKVSNVLDKTHANIKHWLTSSPCF